MPTLATQPSRRKWIETFTVDLLAASVDSNIYISRRNAKVQAVSFALTAAGGSGAAVVLRKCSGTTAPASGTAITASADLNGTATNTVTSPAITQSASYLVAGDRLALDFSGTLTALNGVMTITLETY